MCVGLPAGHTLAVAKVLQRTLGRKTKERALEGARVHRSEVAQFVGHERGFTFSLCLRLGLDLKGLRDVVERIEYPGLDLSRFEVR